VHLEQTMPSTLRVATAAAAVPVDTGWDREVLRDGLRWTGGREARSVRPILIYRETLPRGPRPSLPPVPVPCPSPVAVTVIARPAGRGAWRGAAGVRTDTLPRRLASATALAAAAPPATRAARGQATREERDCMKRVLNRGLVSVYTGVQDGGTVSNKETLFLVCGLGRSTLTTLRPRGNGRGPGVCLCGQAPKD
jgi:hypothetical protein